MTARYNIFKDNTRCTEPATNGLTVATAMVPAESKMAPLPMQDKTYPNSVVNCANVVRGHDILGGSKNEY